MLNKTMPHASGCSEMIRQQLWKILILPGYVLSVDLRDNKAAEE